MKKHTYLFFLSITIILLLGGGYWWLCQQYLISPFTTTLESLAKKQQATPKDIAALKRDRVTLQNNLKSSILKLVSALFFSITASIAWFNLKATEEKQITERFAKAIEQLGSNDLEVRLGAIYSLERLAADLYKTKFIDSNLRWAVFRNPNYKNAQFKNTETSECIF
ncbi:MAG: hypothetical protein KME08_16615 [Aphanothece sp. CMT-3BRIN-NPC111]|jgi:hypothetical protein|nr:hypothetical protein [Aphanothece sp. CMT-3BRIN-NPC111]